MHQGRIIQSRSKDSIINEIKEISTDKDFILLDNGKLDLSEVDVDKSNIINMSILNNEGIDELKAKIVELFNISQIETSDPTYLSNTRSISILESCLESIKEVEIGLGNNQPIDMIELDIKDIWEKLGTINGTTYEEELLDEMFSRFCLGK